MGDFSIQYVIQFQLITYLLFVIQFEFRVQHLRDSHRSFDGFRYVVDILRFDQGLKVVLQDLRKVVL